MRYSSYDCEIFMAIQYKKSKCFLSNIVYATVRIFTFHMSNIISSEYVPIDSTYRNRSFNP